jgi:hypothetical protein
MRCFGERLCERSPGLCPSPSELSQASADESPAKGAFTRFVTGMFYVLLREARNSGAAKLGRPH